MNLEKRRQKWLDKAVELAMAMEAVKEMIDDSCRPCGDVTPESVAKKLPERRRAMADKAAALADLERGAEPPLGVAALLSQEPPTVVRRALTMMILSGVTCRFGGRRDDVGDLIALTTAGDMGDALTLRCAFRNDTGTLRPLVKFEECRGSSGLANAWVALKENAFNLAMGLPNDAEFEGAAAVGEREVGC